MALQLRRGTNAERLAMTPVNGELIFVTDYDLATLSVSAINAGTDTLTSVAHGLSVNQQIKFQDASLNGLVLDQVYFVKTVPSSDTFTLSLTLAGATVDITGTFSIPLIFATSPTDAAGAPLGTNSTPLWVGDGVTVGGVVAASLSLDDLVDVDLASLAEGNTFYYDATTGFWRNTAVITVNDATNNVTLLGDLSVNGGDLTTNKPTFNLLNATATTVNAFGAATATNIGSTASGTTNIGFKANIANDLTVNNGTVLTNSGNVFLFDTVATTIDAFGAATAINMGSATGTTTINNNAAVTFDLAVNGGDLTTNQTTFNLLNATATTVNAFGAATATNIGAATGTTTIGNNLVVTNDLAVNGGDITTTQTTGNLFNATATTVNVGNGATVEVNLGNTGAGRVQIKSPSIVGANTTQAVFNTVATTVNAFGASTATAIGSIASGTTTIGFDLVVNNSINADFISVDNRATLDSSALTTTATATVALNTTTRNAMTGLINIVQGADVHCVNYTALQVDATTALLTTYAEMYNNISLASFSADVSAGVLRLLVTPSSATSTVFSVVRTSLT